MALGGDGPLCIAVLWALSFVVFLILLVRMYTRVVCVAAYGVDDHFYFFTWALMVAYSALTTVAAYHGYGRTDLTAEENVDATYYRMIGQTFSLIATGASKASVGFFLLRLVIVPWQMVSIWVIMIVMGALSIINSFFTWLACKPLEYGWNEPLGGSCFNTVPPAVMLALGTVAVDIYFAVLPWIFIWKLNLPRRERFTIAGSLSLGFLAAVAGAVRVMSVKGVREVPVGVIVWSQVETAMTLICVGIPVCRPLWSRHLRQWLQVRTGSAPNQNDAVNSEPIGMYTIGGGAISDGQDTSKRSKKRDIVIIFTRSNVERSRGDDTHSDEVDLTGPSN